MTAIRDVIVVGGGLAGLNAAKILSEHGRVVRLLESGDNPGGRVRTDRVEGFQLDRGFQVLLTAYPEAQTALDYGELDLHAFYPGALVRFQGRFERIADPWRKPIDGLQAIMSPIVTLSDLQRVASIRSRVRIGQPQDVFSRPETSTLNYLRSSGVSQRMIDYFFAPFFGGIFLDRSLRTSSCMFEFIFRMMSAGDIALPRDGMGTIADQMTQSLPAGVLRLESRVVEVSAGTVLLASGEQLQAETIVVAVDGPSVSKIVSAADRSRAYLPVTCLYFAAERPPVTEPVLIVNADETGPVNNLCVPSAVSPSYAPPGAALVSVTVLGERQPDEELINDVRRQLQDWFGIEVDSWGLLQTYRIDHALPDQRPPLSLEDGCSPIPPDRIYYCGDYLDSGSINGALRSGRRVAEAILQEADGLRSIETPDRDVEIARDHDPEQVGDEE